MNSHQSPSPPCNEVATAEAATELLGLGSRGSLGKSDPGSLASLGAAPADSPGDAVMKSLPDNKAAVQNGAVATPASGALATTKEQAQDNNAKVAPARLVNRPVDHTYTDYAPISDFELQQLDRDMTYSMLKSPTLSPEKKKLLEALRDMPSKSGNSQSFPTRVRVVFDIPIVFAARLLN